MSAANTLDEIDYRILSIARERPGVGACAINEGKTRTGGFVPIAERWITNNQRAGRVYMLRREGYLEPHTQTRPGLYITAKGCAVLEAAA
jgi:hypothetical protein